MFLTFGSQSAWSVLISAWKSSSRYFAKLIIKIFALVHVSMFEIRPKEKMIPLRKNL